MVQKTMEQRASADSISFPFNQHFLHFLPQVSQKSENSRSFRFFGPLVVPTPMVEGEGEVFKKFPLAT